MEKTCCMCKKTFEITEDHLKWFEERGLKPFERCSECRAKKKRKGRNKKDRYAHSDLIKMLYGTYDRLHQKMENSYDEKEVDAMSDHLNTVCTVLGDLMDTK